MILRDEEFSTQRDIPLQPVEYAVPVDNATAVKYPIRFDSPQSEEPEIFTSNGLGAATESKPVEEIIKPLEYSPELETPPLYVTPIYAEDNPMPEYSDVSNPNVLVYQPKNEVPVGEVTNPGTVFKTEEAITQMQPLYVNIPLAEKSFGVENTAIIVAKIENKEPLPTEVAKELVEKKIVTNTPQESNDNLLDRLVNYVYNTVFVSNNSIEPVNKNPLDRMTDYVYNLLFKKPVGLVAVSDEAARVKAWREENVAENQEAERLYQESLAQHKIEMRQNPVQVSEQLTTREGLSQQRTLNEGDGARDAGYDYQLGLTK